jgi:hypothetical protein
MITNYRPLAYTAPQSKLRFELPFDGALSDSVTHNLGAFQFAGQDGIFHQDNSLNTGDYTFVLLIDDQTVLQSIRDIFNEKKTDDSVGELEHPDPTIGTFPAVISKIVYGQNTIKKSGIARITVTFQRDIPNLLGGDPLSSSAGATVSAIDDINIDQANDFANSVDLTTGAGLASLTDSVISVVNTATETLGTMSQGIDSIAILFDTTALNIINTIDELITKPFELAQQLQNLIQLPMLAINQASARLKQYGLFSETVLAFTETDQQEFEAGSSSGANILSVAGLASLASVSAINYSAVSTESVTISEIKSGAVIISSESASVITGTPDTEAGTSSVSVGGYLSRPQIIETIQAVLSSALTTIEILGEKASLFGATTFFTQYFDYSILNKTIVSNTVKNLNERIFNTAREVVFITEEETNIIEWCNRLYNSVELPTLEFFKSTNNLHGDNVFLVGKGVEVVYYV